MPNDFNPAEVAEQFWNGNRTAARAAIMHGTQQQAASRALRVLDVLIEGASDGQDIAIILDSWHRCITNQKG